MTPILPYYSGLPSSNIMQLEMYHYPSHLAPNTRVSAREKILLVNEKKLVKVASPPELPLLKKLFLN